MIDLVEMIRFLTEFTLSEANGFRMTNMVFSSLWHSLLAKGDFRFLPLAFFPCQRQAKGGWGDFGLGSFLE
jgi:hypothetical protein